MSVDYLAESKSVTKEFLESILDSKAEWKLSKESDGVKVFNRKPEKGKVTIFKSEATVDCSPAQAIDFLNPAKPFRLQWDQLLEKLEVVEDLGDGVMLVYHIVKAALKGLLSARDSMDVVTVGETDDFYYVAAAGVTHPDYPVNKQCVRVTQFPCGYIVYKKQDENGHTKIIMILNADLNMNFATAFVAEQVKPTLMIQTFSNLKSGLKDISYSS